MPTRIFAACALVAAALLPATAVTAQAVDNSALTVTGERTDNALSTYLARVAARPADETAWLNIAILQAHAGRTMEARQAVAHVMSLNNAVVQNQFGDDVWTHDWAQGVTARNVTLSMR